MKIALISILAIAGLAGLGGCATYSSLVSGQEEVSGKWGVVETQYQRRADLVPNLVEVTKGYAAHEKETFLAVTEARASVGQLKLDGVATNEAEMQKFVQAQDQLKGALSRLLVVAEKYPDLKASEQFISLQREIAGTENRIATARRDHQLAAQSFNTRIRQPMALVVRNFVSGFEAVPYFQSDAGAAKAPTVKF